jgi:hypothetical protein
MEYILRKMEITTLEQRVELDDLGYDQTPEQIRHRIQMSAELGGWDTHVKSHQTVLIEVGEDDGYGSKRIGNWSE